jgi:hypothetical protein
VLDSIVMRIERPYSQHLAIFMSGSAYVLVLESIELTTQVDTVAVLRF